MLRVPSEIKDNQFESLKLQETTFVAYRSDIYPSKNDVFFEENAIIYVLEGDKIFSNATQEVRVQKGDILVIKRGFYLMSESTNESYKSLVFFLNDKLLKEFVSQNLEIFNKTVASVNNSGLLFTLNSSSALDIFVTSILPYFKNRTQYLNQFLKLKVQELLLHLIECDNNAHLKNLLFSVYLGEKADLKEVVNNYCLKPLTLNELAKLSGRSLSSFKREFAELFGVPPGHWIKDKKLDHAAFLLKNKMGNVEEVSDAVGYESVSHFIKTFKQKYGVTPFQMRR